MSEVECPYCHAKGEQLCTTKTGRSHPSRDAAILYDRLCKATITIGSYPGDETFGCELYGDHEGDHRYTYEWARGLSETQKGGQDAG